MKVVHFQYIENFASEFTPQSIITDFVSYYNDLLKGPQKEDGMIIDELKKWFNPKSTIKEKTDAVDKLVSYYILNSNSEVSYHIRILGISNLTTDNLKK